MPYVVHPSSLPRYCPIFQPEIETPFQGTLFVDSSRKDGRLLDPDQIPKSARRVSGGTEMPDLFAIAAAWCISERLKEIIEKLEPNVHYFYHVPLFQKDGSAITTRHFLFDIRQIIDAVVPEASDTFLSPLPDGRSVVQFKDYTTVAVDLTKVARHHVWRGKKHLSGLIFMSDDLVAVMQKQKIKRPEYYKTRQVISIDGMGG